jgi:hypothetical protein
MSVVQQKDEGFLEKIKGFFLDTVVNSITEIHILMPDSILFGSLLMYFLTQNMAFGVFAIFIFETSLSHRLISWISAQAVGESRSANLQCRPGYKTPQFNPQRMFSSSVYPSYAVYTLTAIGTYLGLATNEFSETLDTMGEEWALRKNMAYGFIALFLAVFVGFRLLKCDTISEILIAMTFAFISAILFFTINKSLFGSESVNFLGLPYIVSKESQGSPIYVCSAEKEATP